MSLLDYEKNTDADWEEIAQGNPYWGVLTDDRFLNKNLSSGAIDEFFESGRKDIAAIADELNIINDRKLDAVLDFGSGVGRLAIPMAEYAQTAVGIEISNSMRTEINKNLKKYKVKNVKVFKTCEDMLAKSPVTEFDWVNSQIVFQHIPPVTGYRILGQLLKVLKIGGYFSLHFNIFRISSSFSKADVFQQIDSGTLSALYSDRDEEFGYMQMYDYDLNKVYYLFLK